MSEQSNMPNTWNSANYGFEMKSNELNCGSPQIPSYFFNPSWDNSVDHNNDPFESALSSMVSSPTVGMPPTGGSVGDGKTIVLSELIGKLGGISNNIGDISTHSSCYSTPLNSPPKLSSLSMVDHQIRGNLPIPYRNVPSSHQISVPFSPDLGFAERAARFSSFNGNRAFGPNGNESSHNLTPKLEPISQSGKMGGSQFGGKARSSSQDQKFAPEIVDSREGSSVSYQISGGESANARKRKSASKGKTKDNNHNPSSSSPPSKDAKMGEGHEESNGKRIKANEKEEANENKDNSKPPEPSTKDYIHVRARRGQATDSHSLAERVRREKISERMKFLQDLVPGCNKVTGKAVMLDEIINYVQSLQRQVEFLSMKLSTLNPRMELNLETILSKDIFQSRTTMAQNIYPFEPAYGTSMNGFSVESLNNALHQNTILQVPPVESHADLASSQAATFWDDELHNIVKMGFGENLFQNSQY